jgi:hypothetical protein
MNTGQNLLNAVAAIKSASAEISDLFSEFSNALQGQTATDGVQFRRSKKLADHDGFRVGWAQDGWLESFNASDGGKVRNGAYRGELTLAVDLGHRGWFADKLARPYLLLFWAPANDSWIGFVEDPDEFVVTSTNYCVVDGRFFVWLDEGEDNGLLPATFKNDPLSRAWFIATPLMAIDTRKKVHDHLVQPVFDLLNNTITGLAPDHPADRFRLDARGVELATEVL